MTESELLDALRLALEPKTEGESGALRTRDISRLLGVPAGKIRVMLGELLEAGVIEMVKIPLMDISGRVNLMPAYKLRESKED